MLSWLVVVSKLCISDIKLTNVSMKNLLVYRRNIETQVSAAGRRTHWNLF
jgi:hypothetical protein